jgi:hypothetical protein
MASPGLVGMSPKTAVEMYNAPASCCYTMMNRTAFIEKLTEIQRTVEQLLTQLQTNEHDAFAAHLYRSRREYRSACDHSGKSGKQIEQMSDLDL